MKTIKRIALAAMALVALSSCDAQQAPKFDAKDYAERKTARLDQIVTLTDAQEKEVYALFLEQGKQIKDNIKEFKKECGAQKCPDGRRGKATKPANCPQPKANCPTPENCPKVKGGKCPKPENCPKVKGGECPKPENCPKVKDGECPKPENCPKVKGGECPKGKVARRDGRGRRAHLHGVNPEEMKALYNKISTILTPEQNELLKVHRAQRFQCAPNAANCCPSEK